MISFDDLQQLPKAEPLSLTKQLRDDERVLEALVPAPVGALLVAPDNLGRVLLLDGADMVAVRIWKVGKDAFPVCLQFATNSDTVFCQLHRMTAHNLPLRAAWVVATPLHHAEGLRAASAACNRWIVWALFTTRVCAAVLARLCGVPAALQTLLFRHLAPCF